MIHMLPYHLKPYLNHSNINYKCYSSCNNNSNNSSNNKWCICSNKMNHNKVEINSMVWALSKALVINSILSNNCKCSNLICKINFCFKLSWIVKILLLHLSQKRNKSTIIWYHLRTSPRLTHKSILLWILVGSSQIKFLIRVSLCNNSINTSYKTTLNFMIIWTSQRNWYHT